MAATTGTYLTPLAIYQNYMASQAAAGGANASTDNAAAGGAGGPAGAATGTLTATASPAPSSSASTSSTGGAGTYLTSFDPSKLQNGNNGTLANGMNVLGYAGNTVDEGGIQGSTAVTGYSAFDPGHQAVGDKNYDYDASGKFVGTHEITPENGTWKDLAQGIATVAAAYFGFNAAFAGVGAAAEGAAGGAADAGTGAVYTSPGEMDATLAEQTAGTGGVNGTALTGGYVSPGQVDQQLAEQTAGGGYVSPGEVDQQLAEQTAGSNGNYVSPGEVDQQLAEETAGNGGVTGGDGVGPLPEEGGAVPFNPIDWIKDLITGGTGTSVIPGTGSILPFVVSPLLQKLLTPGDGGAGAPPAAVAPPQPEVGAGSYATAAAQGGASGSLQGVAGTLLTSKDSFGYGKSMA